jgi:hypothetical protein
MPIIKWVASLTKLYQMSDSLMGQRQHPTFRHPPKTQILREDRLPRTGLQQTQLVNENFCGWKRMFSLDATFNNFPELKG